MGRPYYHPDSQNPYIYVVNNPLIYGDPSGHMFDVIMDVASLAYDAYQFVKDPSWANAGYVALDAAAALVPFVPSASTSIRALSKADDGLDAVSSAAKGTGNGANSSIKSVDDILEGASPGRVTKGKATQYGKSGGYNQATDDFISMNVTNVKDIPGGKVGELPDGSTVNVREKSSDGRPTLEIYDGKKSNKIRYDD